MGLAEHAFAARASAHLLASRKTALISTAAQTPPRKPKIRFARVSSHSHAPATTSLRHQPSMGTPMRATRPDCHPCTTRLTSAI